jgi:hypothetical protein
VVFYPNKWLVKWKTPKGKLEFAKRKEAVEWPFGNIKQNLKFNEFYTCGLAQTEKNLLVISHNIKRIYNKIQSKCQENT